MRSAGGSRSRPAAHLRVAAPTAGFQSSRYSRLVSLYSQLGACFALGAGHTAHIRELPAMAIKVGCH